MRILLFFIVIMSYLSTAVHAQNEWVDYIVGRPNMFYIDAKKATAKDWGIVYTTEMAGCIDCENTRLRAQEIDQQNQAYLKLLALRYGQNWLSSFNKAVAKKHNFLLAQEQQEKGIWYELLQSQGDSEYYSIKKTIAAEWGIQYKAVFYDNNSVLDPLEKEQLQQQFEASNTYQEQLQNRLGDQWSEWIEQESKLRLLQKLAPQKGVWVDVVWGMPNSPYYKAKAAVAKRWGINYETRLMGNVRTTALVNNQRDLMRQNAVYFSSLNQHFKRIWMTTFYREVQQAYAKEIQ
ncbi:MAG: hypothetical protein ACRBFS_23365 [Aureispira sp.]